MTDPAKGDETKRVEKERVKDAVGYVFGWKRRYVRTKERILARGY
jgi:hypothetical protein